MKYNRLWTRAARRNHEITMLSPMDERRCSGRSTATALEGIASAIQFPGAWVTLRDHHGTQEADRVLRNRVETCVSQMGLKFFEFAGDDPCKFRCNLFTNSPWQIE